MEDFGLTIDMLRHAGLHESLLTRKEDDVDDKEYNRGPWDAVYLGNVTHLFDAAEAKALIGAAGAALVDGGVLAVQEVVRGLSGPGHRFAVLMLLATAGGDTHTEDQYRAWMAAAGCPVERVVELAGQEHHLLTGTRRA